MKTTDGDQLPAGTRVSDYQPKVGDRVMVGEHGPYRVVFTESGAWADLRSIPENNVVADGVPLSWLTPAPEPESDEPTAPGALVRDGGGELLFCSPFMGTSRWYEINTPGGGYWTWAEITRPVTVILADPAEVERLRAEVERVRATAEAATADLIHARRRADELQRRINIVVGRLDAIHMPVKEIIARLRGEMS